jgi:hypothetical protein
MTPLFQPAALAQASCGLTTQCGLTRALNVLYGAATFLTLVLITVLGVAIYFYRRNKRSEPKDK